MKLKKLFALALAGVMTLALLTGCGDKPGDKPEDTLRAEALADIINVQRGVNITCEADPQLSEAAERYTHVSSEDGSTLLINKLKLGNYHSIGSEPRKALLKTIGIDPNTTNKQVIFYCGEDGGCLLYTSVPGSAAGRLPHLAGRDAAGQCAPPAEPADVSDTAVE